MHSTGNEKCAAATENSMEGPQIIKNKTAIRGTFFVLNRGQGSEMA